MTAFLSKAVPFLAILCWRGGSRPRRGGRGAFQLTPTLCNAQVPLIPSTHTHTHTSPPPLAASRGRCRWREQGGCQENDAAAHIMHRRVRFRAELVVLAPTAVGETVIFLTPPLHPY